MIDKAKKKSGKGFKDNMRKLRRVKGFGQVLCSPTLQLPLLVNDLLHMPGGYQSGCVELQQTCAVFFRLHICAARMWWQLVFLGSPQWERQQLIDRILGRQQASLQPGEMGWMFRCRFCGLLRQHAKSMVDHFRDCHPDSSWVYGRLPQNYEPQRLRRVLANSAALPITRLNTGADPFAGLALRQPGSIVPSLEVAGAYAVAFAKLVALLDWGLHWKAWVAFVQATLPAHVWRLCPNFWKAYQEAVLWGTFKQVPLSVSTAKAAGPPPGGLPGGAGINAAPPPPAGGAGINAAPSPPAGGAGINAASPPPAGGLCLASRFVELCRTSRFVEL